MKTLKPKFVEYIPFDIEEGTIFISMQYKTAVHKCACGCGEKVVTPFSPSDWKLWYDGKTISLHPSIGNWSFPCRSHYLIKHNEIIDIPEMELPLNNQNSSFVIKTKNKKRRNKVRRRS